jgi:hypothetical protein
LRFSDIKRPAPRPRYTVDGLSDARHAEVTRAIKNAITNGATTPVEAEDAYVDTITSLLDGYAKADRKARNSERHTLISKLDALAARVRLTRRGSPQRTAMQAQEARVQKQPHLRGHDGRAIPTTAHSEPECDARTAPPPVQ